MTVEKQDKDFATKLRGFMLTERCKHCEKKPCDDKECVSCEGRTIRISNDVYEKFFRPLESERDWLVWAAEEGGCLSDSVCITCPNCIAIGSKRKCKDKKILRAAQLYGHKTA